MSLYLLFCLHLCFIEKIYPGKCRALKFCYFPILQVLREKTTPTYRIQEKQQKPSIYVITEEKHNGSGKDTMHPFLKRKTGEISSSF